MKAKKLNEIRKKDIAELESMVVQLKNQKNNTYAKIAVGKEQNLKSIREAKKDIAQIMTIINEMKKTQQREKDNKGENI